MSKLKAKILVVDDNAGIRATLKLLLPARFSEVEIISSPKELMSKLQAFRPNVVLLDMNFEADINTGNEGLYWLSEIKRHYAEVEVVLFTAYANISLAVEGMKRGAFDFIVKPWQNEKLFEVLEAACQKHKNVSPAKQESTVLQMLWGKSASMKALHQMVEKIAPTEASVLITGENGTGKDVLANEIHRLSSRSGREMVSVDLGSIPETLFESELFGHVKGAFTDAHTEHKGKLEEANGTTLFLDEIGNIPIHLQAKLLRVLQNRSITKVGDTKAIPLDIRLICATNKDLPQMVSAGTFREDLYYRINTVTLHLPPLRERTDEISFLVPYFIEQFALKYHREVKGIAENALSLLENCQWRGNIRELKNRIEKAVILSEGELIQASDLQITDSELRDDAVCTTQGESLQDAEERIIRQAMKKYNGNLTLVAKALNISRPTLYNRLKKYGI